MTLDGPRQTHRSHPLFFTFYSYKGGVGRTLALLYSAIVLAGRRRRVLMIDFDLEAPGLTLLANRADPAAKERPGLVELIADANKIDARGSIVDQSRPNAFRERYVYPLPIPEYAEILAGGTLDLMPCGALGKDYEEQLYKLRFKDLYAEGIGAPFFEHFKEVIRRSGAYDYVFIDSRTGFSDEGGICTRDLADAIVLVTGLNHQNVDGTIRFLHRASSGGAPLENLILVFSPIPAGYEELRRPRERAVLDELDRLRPGHNTRLVRVPYHPRIALDEEPFVFEWRGAETWRSYQDIGYALREIANDTPTEMAQRVIAHMGQGRHDEAVRDAVDLATEDARLFDLIVESTAAPVHADAAARLIAEPFLSALSVARPLDVTIWANLAVVRERSGDLEGALAAHERVVALVSTDRAILGRHHSAMGRLLARLGRYNDALKQHRIALDCATSDQDTDRVVVCGRELGKVYLLSGRFQDARLYFDEALKLLHNGTRQSVIRRAQLLRLSGDVSFALGEFRLASQSFSHALEEADRIDDDHGRCQAEWRFGRTDLEQGYFDAAATSIQHALEISERVVDQAVRGECFLARARLSLEMGNLVSVGQDLNVSRSLLPDEGEAYVFDYGVLVEGLLLDLKGQWDEASAMLGSEVRVAEDRGRPLYVINTLLALGTVLRHAGKLEEAREHYGSALRRANRLRLLHKRALAISELGYIDVLTRLDVEGGLAAMHSARKRFSSVGQKGFALTTAIRLGDSYVRLGDPEQALTILTSVWDDLVRHVSPVAFNEARIVRARAGLMTGGSPRGLKQAVEFARERGIVKPFFLEAADLLKGAPDG